MDYQLGLIIGLIFGIILGLFYYITGKTGSTASMAKKAAIVLVIGCFAGLIIFYPATFSSLPGLNSGQDENVGIDGCEDFTADYIIVPAYDSSTATDPASYFTGTDEAGYTAGEYTLNYNTDGSIKGITWKGTFDWSAETASAGTGGSFDVLSQSYTITRRNLGTWCDGAQKTTLLTQTVSPTLVEQEYQSSNVSGRPMIPVIQKNTYGVSGVLLANGAGTSGEMGGLSNPVTEYSPGESDSAAGFYAWMNEHELSLYYTFGTYTFSWDIIFIDDTGYSRTFECNMVLIIQE